MNDYDGPEPTDAQILKTVLPGEGFNEGFHEQLILKIAQAGADSDGIYRQSTKRLALATGLPKSEIDTILLMLTFAGKIKVTTDGIKAGDKVGA